jgi:coenzyme F420-reducing hydrogenase gamma subunit
MGGIAVLGFVVLAGCIGCVTRADVLTDVDGQQNALLDYADSRGFKPSESKDPKVVQAQADQDAAWRADVKRARARFVAAVGSAAVTGPR